jgi:predicted unusual protein kinase regulating ubiquinone biosynthesis (AarF/ABC1/UbiB family)
MKRNATNTAKATETQTVKTVTCRLVFKAQGKDASGETIEQRVFVPSDFTKSLAAVLKEFSSAFTLHYLGMALEVPKESTSVGNLQRTMKVVEQLAAKVYPASSELLDTLKPTDEAAATLQSLRNMGVKFTTLCKRDVLNGIKYWVNVKRAALRNLDEQSKSTNKEYIGMAKALNEDTKVRRAENLSAITGLVAGYVKQGNLLTLPASKK